MKLISKLSLKKPLLLLIPLALAGAALWHWGPLLVIAQHSPLKDPHKRLALILTLFLAWLLKFLFLDNLQPATADSQNVTQLLHVLRGRFLGALRFLKKTLIDKHGYSTPLNKLPWYLLIGPPGAGKTTLLAYSTINFILSKQYKQEGPDKGIAASSVCDWWVTRDLVLVDVPGCYTFSPPQDPILDSEENQASSASSKPHLYLSLWKSLLHLLTKHRQKNNIGALIIALHLPEIMKQARQQQTQWFQDLKERLVESWAKFGNLPVYFIVTKCDLLPGFCEFFNDIGSDELTQPWGIPLSARKEHENLLDVFTQRFNALIKKLNKQLIWRLHQERNAPSRPLIKDFPLQLEFLKETLGHLLKMLVAVNPGLDVEGIYLTSTTQENLSSSATTLFHQDVPSELQLSSPSPFISRAYFVKHIISYLLPHTSHHLTQRFRQKTIWLPRLAYGLGFGALLIGALWFGNDFQRSLYQVSSMQRYLSQYQLYLQQNNPQDATLLSIGSALPLLHTLEGAAEPHLHLSRLEQIETLYSQQSQQTGAAIYRTALETIVMPPLKAEFEKYLQSADNSNPEQLYAALKAYLMLKKPDPSLSSSEAANFIIKTLENISPLLNKNPLSKALTQQIQNSLQAQLNVSLNHKLVRQARKTLNFLPDNDLAYLLLIHMNHNNADMDINLGTNIGTPPALISKGTATLIPQMFTATAFDNIVKEQIPLAAQEAIKGNEVLGKKTTASDSLISEASTINSLTEQLDKTYLSHYIDIWESLVDNISLNTPKSLTETDAMIMNLISIHSPLLQLLQAIHNNTNLEPVLSNSFKLQALNTLFNQTQTKQKDSLYQIFVDLHQLHVLLQQASASHFSKDKMDAKQATITQILNMAEKYPEPIKNWLQSLVSYTQSLLQAEIKLSPALEQKPVLVQNSVPPPPVAAVPLKKTGLRKTKKPVVEEDEASDTIDPKAASTPKNPSEPSLVKQHHKLAVQKSDNLHILSRA